MSLTTISIKSSSKTVITIDQDTPVTFSSQPEFDVTQVLSKPDDYLVQLLQDRLKKEAEEIAKEVDEFDEKGAWNQARQFWMKNWDNVKWCFENNKIMYLFAYVQSRKTVYYNALIQLVLQGFEGEPALADVAWLSTNNMLASLGQNLDRAKDTLMTDRYGIDVRSSEIGNNDQFYFMKNQMYIGIHNPSRMRTLRRSLEHTEAKRRAECEKTGREYVPLRVLVLLDEGDEVNSDMANTDCANNRDSTATERILFDIRQDFKVNVVSVSATTTSLLVVYSNFYGKVGPLDYRQVFEPTVSKHYKGVVNPHTGEYNDSFIHDGLVMEDERVFKGGKYKPSATIGNTHNPLFIANKIIGHYNNRFTNPEELAQIATVTLGAQTKGHTRTGELIKDSLAFVSGERVQLIDMNMDSVAIDTGCSYIVLTHNGKTNSLNPAKKMRVIYDAFNSAGTTLKGIVFVGGYLLGRAVTYEIPGEWFKKDGDYFGAYCNLTFTYPSKSISAEAIIQTMRVCGVRPSYKAHVTYTTEGLQSDIKGYYTLTREFLSHLKTKGQLDQKLVLEYGLTCNLTKARVEKYTGITKATESRHAREFDNIENSERADLVKNGYTVGATVNAVTPVDCFIKITDQEYNLLNTITNSVIGRKLATVNYAVELFHDRGHGWVVGNGKITSTRNLEHTKYFKAGARGFHEDGVTVSSYIQRTENSFVWWKNSSGEAYLYHWAGKNGKNDQWLIHYHVDIDHNGRICDLDRANQKSILEKPIRSGSTLVINK